MISKESTVARAFQYMGRTPQTEKANKADRSPVSEEESSEADDKAGEDVSAAGPVGVDMK
jgi:hypothetical protein